MIDFSEKPYFLKPILRKGGIAGDIENQKLLDITIGRNF